MRDRGGLKVGRKAMSTEFHHGQEPRAEEIALHQRFLTLLNQMEAAQSDHNESEVRRLRPLLEHARKRWLKSSMRLTRGR
jgi:transposase